MVELIHRTAHLWRQLPVLLRLALIYLSARLVTFGVLLAAANASGVSSRYGAAATVKDFIVGWDANWYWIVADVGYPHELVLNSDGHATENAWAFMPLYAWIAKSFSLPFGGAWVVGAAILSLLAGSGACLMLFALMRTRLTVTQSLWAVVFFANGPLAALFHVGYAEGLFLFFLLGAMNALVRRNFWWLYAFIPLMGYTRPGVLPFALMLGLYGVWRWFRRPCDPLPGSQIVHIVVAGLLASLVGLSWPIIAGAVMGDSTAYFQTELSWRLSWLPESTQHFIPFDGWIIGMNFWFAYANIPAVVGWIAFAAVLVGAIWLLVGSRAVENLGMEVRLFSASYVLYMLAVFFPQSSTLRLFIPLAPLWGAPAQLRSDRWRVAVLVGCLIYQAIWIFEMYAYGNSVTRIP